MTKPLFMWAGGKTRLLRHYKPYMPSSITKYSEPFFGGGAMFIHVIENYNPIKVSINDVNVGIMNIYSAIKSDVQAFQADVDSLERRYLPLTKSERHAFYMKVRQHHAYDYMQWSKTREAAVLYFLMKVGFNGIYQINKNTNGRFGTPPGLLNQTTEIYDRDVVKWWNRALQNVEILSVDWKQVPIFDDANSFTFYDPPYRGSFTSYGQSFTDEDQLTLLRTAEEIKTGRVFLSNRDVGDGFFDNTSLNQIKIPVVYTAGRRRQTESGFEAKSATEILLYN